MPDQDGFEIFKRFYPAPTRFRMGDPVLVKEVTGMTWPEFTAGLDAMELEYAGLLEQGRADEFEPDHVLLLGLMAVAFWQGNPTMGRAKAVRAIERIPLEDVEFIAADVEVDASPPAVAEAGAMQSPTSSGFDGSPAAQDSTEAPPVATLDATSPNGSGSPGLPSVPLESLPA